MEDRIYKGAMRYGLINGVPAMKKGDDLWIPAIVTTCAIATAPHDHTCTSVFSAIEATNQAWINMLKGKIDLEVLEP